MNSNDEITMTYTSVLTKDGKPLVSVSFTRGNDTAEGIIPACEITRNEGFSVDEAEALADFLKVNRKEIIAKSKEISGLFHIL